MLLGLMFMLLGLMFMDIPKALLPEERKLLHPGTRHRELQTEHVLCQLLNVLGGCHKIHLQNGDKYAVPTIGSQHKNQNLFGESHLKVRNDVGIVCFIKSLADQTQ